MSVVALQHRSPSKSRAAARRKSVAVTPVSSSSHPITPKMSFISTTSAHSPGGTSDRPRLHLAGLAATAAGTAAAAASPGSTPTASESAASGAAATRGSIVVKGRGGATVKKQRTRGRGRARGALRGSPGAVAEESKEGSGGGDSPAADAAAEGAAGGAKERRKQVGRMDRLKRRLTGGDRDMPLSRETLAMVKALRISNSQVKRIKWAFDQIDIDGSGEIDKEEFFEFLEEQRSPFSDALFALSGSAGKTLLTFDEFLRIALKFCMYSKEDILRFTFDYFDKDSSGALDEEEFVELCHIVHNKNPAFPGNFRRALEEFDTNDDGLIDFDEFTTINKKYPMMLFPAFRLQDQLQRKTLGVTSWNNAMAKLVREKRIEEYQRLHDGELPPTSCWARLRNRLRACFKRNAVAEEAYMRRRAGSVKVLPSAAGRRDSLQRPPALSSRPSQSSTASPAPPILGGTVLLASSGPAGKYTPSTPLR